MIPTYVTVDRFIADARRTPVILNSLLANVTQEYAMSATDGPDGWSVTEVMGHLRDFEGFFRGRAEMMLAEAHPTLPAYDHEALAIERDYRHQDLRGMFDAWLTERRDFLRLFESLSPEQFARTGVHPENGPIMVFDSLIQLTHHDLTHLDQIARCLELSDRLL
ncbi:MAG: DinB family protein [Thermomicrobiales bacterium]|nr:DinB family protein [Thermomicrobiales bacterium]